MGMDSGDALAHQQVALNLIFSHSSHLHPILYPSSQTTAPQYLASVGYNCSKCVSTKSYIFHFKIESAQMTIN